MLPSIQGAAMAQAQTMYRHTESKKPGSAFGSAGADLIKFLPSYSKLTIYYDTRCCEGNFRITPGMVSKKRWKALVAYFQMENIDGYRWLIVPCNMK